MAESVEDKAGGAGTERRGNGNDRADESLDQIKAARASREIDDDEHSQDGDRGRTNPAKALSENEDRVVGRVRE